MDEGGRAAASVPPNRLSLPKPGGENLVVHGEDDDHGHAASDHSGNDAADRVAHSLVGDERYGDGVPYTGEQVTLRW